MLLTYSRASFSRVPVVDNPEVNRLSRQRACTAYGSSLPIMEPYVFVYLSGLVTLLFPVVLQRCTVVFVMNTPTLVSGATYPNNNELPGSPPGVAGTMPSLPELDDPRF